MPSRLLDVSLLRKHNLVRLHEAPTYTSSAYAALSYCWGGSRNLLTTTTNLAQHKRAIPTDSLPLTILDAALLASSLGLAYLWIDALCILQDSPEDKQTEILRMADIFRSSRVTIVASAAQTVYDGFLNTPRAPLQGFDILQKDALNDDNDVAWIELDESSRPRERYWSQGPNTRSWCLEERYLSARLLIFTNADVIWVCRDCTDHLDRGTAPVDNGEASIREVRTSMDVNDVVRRWMSLVGNYTRRKLTKADDSVNAIAGIAKDFAEAWGHLLGEYKAGLWAEHLELLVWRRENALVKGQESYIAPSWSWLNGHAEVTHQEWANTWFSRAEDDEIERQRLFTVVNIEVKNVGGVGM